ncbi:leucine-rich repeat domain-containing protein [uncultured Eubacterium sp.]|uniref:leucine-rich repeat domain-containing protein n=1 Tax=uncultured Eubacterium sp. TaxID=165185 RepID=UPI0015C11828|nr:leucine-rich repeat domain-containing protein [uncultured Eubacterium sp.]
MSKKKKQKQNDDFLAQEALENQATAQDYTLDIPDDQIWDYQIEGLQKPHINKPYENAAIKKTVFIIVLLIAIFAAMFFSVKAVHSDLYKYEELPDGTYELVRFSNTGSITDITIDYVVDLKTGEKDLSKPITSIHEYAFNGDETLHNITFGKDVKYIDSKAIYSCWYVRNVWIDDENPYYCDIDGVVYNKDVTEAVFYPNYHDLQLMIENGYATEEVDKNGNRKFISKVTDENGNLVDEKGNNLVERLWGTNKLYDEQYYQTYNRTCRTYVIPSTVTKINELAFAYSNIVDLYIPEGVTKMDNMAVFKNTVLTNIFTYTTDTPITDTTYKAVDSMKTIYSSLPESLEYIGSDCLYYTRALNYMYIPKNVTTIKHHAFWDAVYKEDKELRGITYFDVEATEESFNANVTTGDQWRPQYDYMAFKKSVPVNYGVTERKSLYSDNVHRQYYWAVQWAINNLPDDVKGNMSYLVKDLDNDGTPELILKNYKGEGDKILTMKQNYLADYEGEADYESDKFSALDDNAQLDSIYDITKTDNVNYQ